MLSTAPGMSAAVKGAISTAIAVQKDGKCCGDMVDRAKRTLGVQYFDGAGLAASFRPAIGGI